MLKRTLIILTLAPLSQAFLTPGNILRSSKPLALSKSQLDDYNVQVGQNDPSTTRRQAFQHAVALVGFVSTSNVATADVIRAPGRCANGEGDGCDSLAEGNEFIQQLQRRSLENKEENQKEALYAYYMKNYPDVFAVSDKRLVMRKDGSFALFSPEEVREMTQSGRITIEYPKTKGGRVTDLTQKPILVLVD